jgi:hypothetical protein
VVTSVFGCASCLSFYGAKMSKFSFWFHPSFVLFSCCYAVKSSISDARGSSVLI